MAIPLLNYGFVVAGAEVGFAMPGGSAGLANGMRLPATALAELNESAGIFESSCQLVITRL
jgi:hypothetical protein